MKPIHLPNVDPNHDPNKVSKQRYRVLRVGGVRLKIPLQDPDSVVFHDLQIPSRRAAAAKRR